jgi:hypothetical protein
MYSFFTYSHLPLHYLNVYEKRIFVLYRLEGVTWYISGCTTHYVVEERENLNHISSLFTFFLHGLYGCPVEDVSIVLQCRLYVHFAFRWLNASSVGVSLRGESI